MPQHDRQKMTGNKPLIALALQGGGALGAYQLGCYRALHEHGFEPEWISGISIGAVGATILAGNPPERRLRRLQEFWDKISWPGAWGEYLYAVAPSAFVKVSGLQAQLIGQPNFFTPRIPIPQLAPPGTPNALSYADLSPLRDTLLELADFDYINSAHAPRLSLGATVVSTGELIFFDNRRMSLTPEHTMASGALPPGFSPVVIDGTMYWDGGVASNTPLQIFVDDPAPVPMLVFMVDLFSQSGPEPKTIDDVTWRQSQIEYASRVNLEVHGLMRRLNTWQLLAEQLHQATPERAAAITRIHGAIPPAITTTAKGHGELDLVHVVFQPEPGIPPEAGHDFSRVSIENRSAAGYADMTHAINSAPWTSRRETIPQAACLHHCRGKEIRSKTCTG
ncbi:MAG: patatin-like phospholipase family protein [Magnetococcales bacterium]|nr:patatin-like phospholipase family protein [Magnetococcales bacterium]